MSIRGQVGNGTGGKSLPQGSAFFLGCQSRAGRRQRGLPTSPLQSQVTEEKTHPGPTAARQSCWKGKYLGIALRRGCRGAGDREGGLLSLDTGTPRTAPTPSSTSQSAPRALGILPSALSATIPLVALSVPAPEARDVPTRVGRVFPPLGWVMSAKDAP